MTDAPPDTDSTNPLTAGDALAASGDWPAAIRAWDVAARNNPSMRPAVERRLAWLLAEVGAPLRRRSRLLPLIAAFLIASVLGMAFLALAGTPGSRAADLWAIATWIAIAVAVATALVAAKRSGGESLDQLLARARSAAARLETHPERGEIS